MFYREKTAHIKGTCLGRIALIKRREEKKERKEEIDRQSLFCRTKLCTLKSA